MLKKDNYINPHCSYSNLDIFVRRKEILKALQNQLMNFKGIVLDIGCGNMPYRPLILSPLSGATYYIGIDIRGEIYDRPMLYWDGWRMPFKNDSIDCAISMEVLEHCPKPEIIIQETWRVLRIDGFFFFTVPFLWPLHDVPYDEYRYTPFALKRLLMKAGFKNFQLRATGGWDASLSQMLGLWVRRSHMSRIGRLLLRPFISLFLWPLIFLLYKMDKPPPEFRESSMITGIAGTAWK